MLEAGDICRRISGCKKVVVSSCKPTNSLVDILGKNKKGQLKSWLSSSFFIALFLFCVYDFLACILIDTDEAGSSFEYYSGLCDFY